MDGSIAAPTFRVDRRSIVGAMRGFLMLLGLLAVNPAASIAAEPVPVVSLDDSPMLVAELGHHFAHPPAMEVEYESRLNAPRQAIDQAQMRIPLLAEIARFAPFSALPVELPPEDFKELDEGRPRLTTSTLDANDQRSIVGGRMLFNAPLSEQGRLQGEFRLLWLCEYLQSPGAGVTAFFAPGDSEVFVTQGLNYGSNWAILGKRWRWDMPGGLSAFASFDSQVNSREMLHIGSTGLRYCW